MNKSVDNDTQSLAYMYIQPIYNAADHGHFSFVYLIFKKSTSHTDTNPLVSPL